MQFFLKYMIRIVLFLNKIPYGFKDKYNLITMNFGVQLKFASITNTVIILPMLVEIRLWYKNQQQVIFMVRRNN